jgi:succinate dehydrogenase/fumarate reductase cytochrome b subunit
MVDFDSEILMLIEFHISLRRKCMANSNDLLVRINRLLVWPTLVLFVAYVIFGYGIWNPKLISELSFGVLNRTFSLYLHNVLALPVLTLLLVHVLIGLRTALIRWGVKEGNLLNAFLLLLGLFAVILLLLMQFSVS